MKKKKKKYWTIYKNLDNIIHEKIILIRTENNKAKSLNISR